MNTPFRSRKLAMPESLRRGVHVLYETMVAPRSSHEDDRRREFILNVILLGSIALLAALNAIVFYEWGRRGGEYGGAPPLEFLGIFLLFALLYAASRAGHFLAASRALIALYALSILYATYEWGVDLPAALLGYALLIAITSILVNTRAGFAAAFFIALSITFFGYLESTGRYMPDRDWRREGIDMNDAASFACVLLVIAVISWLSNREIERSLRRARRSEAELKRERDLLETKVAERTKALKQVELDKMAQLYRFAELGRHATDIFHELMNPLTAVALNVAELEKHMEDAGEVRGNLEQAIASARRMEKIIQALRKQMGERDASVSYSLNEEIHQVMQLFEYKARTAKIKLDFVRQHDVATYGNPLKLHQVVANLVSNAIDAYEGLDGAALGRREVRITLSEHHDIVRLEVEDWGRGIPPEDLPKIFEPFFTTKGMEQGSGIGLATVKHLVAQSLGGTVRVESVPGQGTKFIVEFAA